MLVLTLTLAACAGGGEPQPASGEGGHYKLGRAYEINGRHYEPYFDPAYRARGVASWYGDPFHGRKTANGERFDKRRLSAAHTTLPLPSLVEVTNLENGRRLVLRVNDRGPFVDDRLIDLSEAAAAELGFKEQGLAPVEVRFLRLADADGTPPRPSRSARGSAGPRDLEPTPPRRVEVPTLTRVDTAACEFWYVQAGAFRNARRAHDAALAVSELFPPSIEGRTARRGSLTHVRVGPFAGHDAAHRGLATVVRAGHDDAFLLKVEAAGERCTAGAAA
jgi:rare lipoprotein A